MYAFQPLRENARYIRSYTGKRTVHYEINPNKISFKGRKLWQHESGSRRKFDNLLILNTPQKRVTISENADIW